MFLDSFNDLSLKQCVLSPTHVKGKTLDVVLSNSDAFISDLEVHDENSVCKSDHFPITFKIDKRVRLKESVKRKCYNYKKANWDALNYELSHTEWNFLDYCEVEIGWSLFKSHLFKSINKHIPQVTVRSNSQPPWFDSDAFGAYRDKERLRKKFKETKNLEDGVKLDISRRNFKYLIAKKMRENMTDSDDHALITKKFWSYVKSTSKSTRIPGCISYNN
jgi:hypothetical protein